MSVTVADIMKLPSLRQATVLAGASALSQIVSSISVLESTDPALLVDGLFYEEEFFGNEIVITGFLNCAHDVELQCANIRRLAEGGEVGLILFYVGVFMPRVDRKLIELANELDFVLIQMPFGQRNLRYSDVINDVTEHIYRDKTRNESIAADILARVSSLPQHQRSINTVLSMLSSRIMCSVILTDASLNALNLVAWPNNLEKTLKSNLKVLRAFTGKKDGSPCGFLPNATVYHTTIISDSGRRMELFLIKEVLTLSATLREQAADVVRLSVNVWGQEHGTVAIRELIRAILQDDPMKMHRLAEIYHTNISAIHEMWVLSGTWEGSPALLKEKMPALQVMQKNCTDIEFADMYEDKLLLFSSTPYSEKDARQQMLAMLGEVEAAELCVSCLKSINAPSDDWDAAETLSVYLLDADSSVTRAAELLHLHKNTVKYRLKVLTDELGYRPDKMPDSMRLYKAAAVLRLLP